MDPFYKAINAIIISIYCFLIAFLVVYHVASTYSYISVYDSFGPIPGNDALVELAIKKGLPIKTFPVDWGWVLAITWIYMIYTIPLLIVATFVINRLNKKIRFHKYWSLALLCCYIGSWGLMWTDKFGGWYTQYVLD